MKAVYKFHFDCGRMGDLHGVFIEEKEKVESLIASGKEVYFGEVLGKHSDISGPIENSDVTMLTDKPEEVELVERLCLTTGYNPFDYIDEDEGDEEDAESEE